MYLKIEETLVQHQQIKDMLTKLDHASPVSGLSIVFGTKNLKTIQNIKWKRVMALNVYYVPVFFNTLRLNGATEDP